MNWGKISILVLGLFMAFIITLVVLMGRSSDDALIDKDYYERGLNFDEDYRNQEQAIKDSVLPEISIKSGNLTISFRDSVDFELSFKRLSDAGMDKTFAGKDIRLNFSTNELMSGPWLMRLNFEIKGKKYLLNREIQMH